MSEARVLRPELQVTAQKWPLKKPFKIAGHSFDAFETVTVRLESEGRVGCGEAAGMHYLGESVQTMIAAIERVRSTIEAGLTRDQVQQLLPAGGARNALDCAWWALEAKLSGQSAWQLADMDRPRPLLTTFTCGAGSPQEMAAAAKEYRSARALKLKLTGERTDAECVIAVREARPDVWLCVDANQGLDVRGLEALMPTLVDCRVSLIEQPFRVGQEHDLDGFDSPIPFAADESVQTGADLAALVGRFQIVNVKLDKCGGLTSGLKMARQAKALGFSVMVGTMGGSSLAMAPSVLVGQSCDVVDLDAPALLAVDRTHAVSYEDGFIVSSDAVWA